MCIMLRVSLFTREWIEMGNGRSTGNCTQVSLFTREWIEIILVTSKSCSKGVSLFTREWIEISRFGRYSGH